MRPGQADQFGWASSRTGFRVQISGVGLCSAIRRGAKGEVRLLPRHVPPDLLEQPSLVTLNFRGKREMNQDLLNRRNHDLHIFSQ